MYIANPGLVLGFHGCDQTVVDDVVSGRSQLNPSKNSFDWLGHGIYFWEGSYDRALSYAQELMSRTDKSDQERIKRPAVLGAIIDLKNCLNLCDESHLKLVRDAYELMELSVPDRSKLPTNRNASGSNDLLLRDLDCAVIEVLHQYNTDNPFDSVKSPFIEGDSLYELAGFRAKNHIQICVRNPDCIVGFFIPRV